MKQLEQIWRDQNATDNGPLALPRSAETDACLMDRCSQRSAAVEASAESARSPPEADLR